MPCHTKADTKKLLEQRRLSRFENPISLLDKISTFARNDNIGKHAASFDALAFGVGKSDFAEGKFAAAG